MEPVKDVEKVKRMFAHGETTLADPSTGYKYEITARCPKDDSFAQVIQTEKTSQGLSRVVFRCSQCSDLFEVKQEEIYVR